MHVPLLSETSSIEESLIEYCDISWDPNGEEKSNLTDFKVYFLTSVTKDRAPLMERKTCRPIFRGNIEIAIGLQ
jgi:hypothetical protein